MDVRTAQLAGGPTNADRVFRTAHAVIALDGASAFEPVDVPADVYAQTLGTEIADAIDDQTMTITAVVARAIARSAHALDLREGHAPCSTVTALRVRSSGDTELYVLGDSPMHYGIRGRQGRLHDERLARIAAPERASYRRHLRAGGGFGPQLGRRLAALQRAQRALRNRAGGYWIAETDPRAAEHAVVRAYPAGLVEWAVLATDGASDGIEATGIGWTSIAGYSQGQLDQLLTELHRWEAEDDPHGRVRPRAKRHDDKTIAVVRLDV